MAIRSREIGWSQKEILLHEILKMLDKITKQGCEPCTTTTSTTIWVEIPEQ